MEKKQTGNASSKAFLRRTRRLRTGSEKSQEEIRARFFPAKPQYIVTTSEFDEVKAWLACVSRINTMLDQKDGNSKPVACGRTSNTDSKTGNTKTDDDRPTLKLTGRFLQLVCRPLTGVFRNRWPRPAGFVCGDQDKARCFAKNAASITTNVRGTPRSKARRSVRPTQAKAKAPPSPRTREIAPGYRHFISHLRGDRIAAYRLAVGQTEVEAMYRFPLYLR